MKIKYVGAADVRSIQSGGWPEDIDGPDVEWNAENDYTAEVKPVEAVNWLLDNDPEFKKA